MCNPPCSPVSAELSPGPKRSSSAPPGHQTDVPRPLPVHAVCSQPGDAAHPRLPRPRLPHQSLTIWEDVALNPGRAENSLSRRTESHPPACCQSVFVFFCHRNFFLNIFRHLKRRQRGSDPVCCSPPLSSSSSFLSCSFLSPAHTQQTWCYSKSGWSEDRRAVMWQTEVNRKCPAGWRRSVRSFSKDEKGRTGTTTA